MTSTVTLDPEPIPLDVKVVLFGDRELYYLLAADDPDFRAASSRCRPTSTTTSTARRRATTPIARLIGSIVKEHGLKPLDRGGVGARHRAGARLADDRDKLSMLVETHPRHRARGATIGRAGQAQLVTRDGRGAGHRRADPPRPTVCATAAQRDDPARHRADRHRGQQRRPDQRPVGAAARRLSRSGGRAGSPRACGSAPAASSTSSARSSSAGRCIPRA